MILKPFALIDSIRFDSVLSTDDALKWLDTYLNIVTKFELVGSDDEESFVASTSIGTFTIPVQSVGMTYVPTSKRDVEKVIAHCAMLIGDNDNIWFLINDEEVTATPSQLCRFVEALSNLKMR